MLKFSEANAKTKSLRDVAELQPYLKNGRKVYSLDMLSGWSCPGARDCLAKVYVDGKRFLQDGPHCKFRCFSASQEVAYPNVYNARKHNFDIMKKMRGKSQCRDMILKCLPDNLGILRFHVGGGFFKQAYLDGAVQVAEAHPDRLFYAYLKSLHFLKNVDMLDPSRGLVRPNFLVTASRGGKYDHLIDEIGIRTAEVVFNEDTDLPIDHDDSHAATAGGSFALLLHGVQPKGSEASVALRNLRGKGTYARK